jgi:hypothetical protein
MEIKFPNPKGMLIAVRFPIEADAIPFTINTLSLSQIQKAVDAVDGLGEVWVNELFFDRENNIVFLGMFVQVQCEGHQLIPPQAIVENDLRNSLAKCGAFPQLNEVAVELGS